jgi:hypothetical protein
VSLSASGGSHSAGANVRRAANAQILAALAHLDTDQHALRIDVTDPQHDNLAAAQTGAVGDPERGLVLETRPGRSLEQAGDLIEAVKIGPANRTNSRI